MEIITLEKERPILFTGEMVQAILEGKKTQTRRVITPQPAVGMAVAECMWVDSGWAQCEDLGEGRVGGCKCSGAPVNRHYGHVGDRLYVRETFETMGYGSWELGIGMPEFEVRYPANGEVAYFIEGTDDRGKYARRRWKRRPSIHMPRFLSRIILEILSVRVERVQDISNLSAKAEGVKASHFIDPANSDAGDAMYRPPFRDFWDLINDGRGYGWDVNPFVWVLDFKVASGPRTSAQSDSPHLHQPASTK